MRNEFDASGIVGLINNWTNPNGRVSHQVQCWRQPAMLSQWLIAALEILHCDTTGEEGPDATAVIQTHFGDIARLSIPMINPISARRRNRAGKKPGGHLDAVEFPRLIKIARPLPARSSIHASQNFNGRTTLQTISTMRTFDDDTLLVSIARVTITRRVMVAPGRQPKSVVIFYMRSNFAGCATPRFMFPV